MYKQHSTVDGYIWFAHEEIRSVRIAGKLHGNFIKVVLIDGKEIYLSLDHYEKEFRELIEREQNAKVLPTTTLY